MIRKLLFLVNSLLFKIFDLFSQKILSPSISLLCFGMFFVFSFVNAATITSTGTGGNWNSGSTWVGGVVPLPTDIVIIASGANVLTNGNQTCAGITITGRLTMINNEILTVNGNVSGNGNWTTGGGAMTISLSGNWSFNGTSTGGGATAIFTGTNTQTLSGKITTSGGELRVNKTGGSLILGSAISIGTFTNTAGIFDAATYLLTATTNNLVDGTLRVGATTWGANYSFSPTSFPSGFTVEYDAANQTVRNATYYNLILSGSGRKTFASTTAITNNLSIIWGVDANLGNGLTHTAGSLTLGGHSQNLGFWGGTNATTATFKSEYYFGTSSTGRVNVGASCNEVAVVISATSNLICKGASATFTATTTYAISPSYQWKVNGGDVGTDSATFSSTTLNNNDIVTCVVTSGVAPCLPSGSTATSNAITMSVSTITASASPTTVASGGTVNLTSSTVPASYTATLLTQDFNNTPTGWTTSGTTGTVAWALRPDGYFYEYTSSGTYEPFTFRSNDNTQFYLSNSATQNSNIVTYLTSPAISITGCTSLSLEFYHYYLSFSGDSAVIEVSANGGTWTAVQSYTTTQGTENNFAKTTIPLNSYANGSNTTIAVRFRYTASFDWFWAIDNVKVTGTKPVTYTYNWAATPSGSTAGLSATNVANPTANPTVTTSYVATATNSVTNCTVSSSPVVVTVTPVINSFTPTSACAGSGTSVVITGSGFNGATAVNFNGVASSYIVNSNTQITATLPSGATTGTITVTTAGGTTTSGSSFTVNPNTAISSQSTAGQTQCVGTAFSAISVTATGTAPVSYQWYSNTTASTTGGTNLGASAQSSSYTPSSATAGTLYYYCVVTGGCSTVTSAVSGAFVVNPNTAISSQSTAGQTQCVGTVFSAISVTATGTAPVSYQWYSNTTASTTGGTNLGASAQNSSYTPSSAAAGTLYYYCVVTGGCSTVTSAISGAFVVNPNTAISTQSTTGQTRCIGNAFSAISVTATGTAPVSYQWYSNTTASTTGGTNLGASAQSNSYTPSSATAGTLYYYCVVTGGCSTVTSAVSGAFVVNPNTAISSQSTAGQTRCIGNAFSVISVTATGTAPVSYQWYSNTTASTTGGTNLGASAQSSSYTPSSATAGTLYYYCVVTGGCSTVTSAVSGAFVVNPNTAISSQSTAGQTQCVGTAFSAISVTATGTAPVSYQWYSNTTASTTGGTNLGASAQSSSYTPSSSTVGTLYYYCIVTGGCSTVTSAVSGAFVVNPNTAISSQSTVGQTRCIGNAFSAISVTATGTAPVSYQWYSNTTASTTGGTNLGASAQSSSYTPSSSTVGTLYYYCIVTGGCSTVTSAVSGAFVVNPNLPASVSIAASPSGAICAGTSVTFTATSTNQGTAPTYVWYKGATIISGASGSTYTTNGLLNGDQISVQMTSNATPCLTGSPATSNVVTMTVNPNPSTPVASVTTQPNCGVPTGTITVTSPAPAAGINYSIDGSNYTNANGIFTGVAPGSYTVSVRNSSGCITSMAAPLTVAMTGSKVWSGATDTNWSVATNWTPNGVPNNGDCVVIPDLTSITNKPAISGTGTVAHAYTLLVDDKSSLTVNTLSILKVENEVTVLGNGSLVFEDKSSLLQTSNNSNTGNITYKRRSRPVRRYDFTYWTAPIYSAAYKLKNLSPATLGDKYYSYDVANAAWKIDYNGASTMELAKGYSVRAPQTYDITGAGQVYDATFIGVPNNGTISAGTTGGKWNLIGNPYPSALDAEDFINLNLSSNAVETGALYFWTHKALPSDAVAGDAKYNYTSDDYAVFNLTGGTVTIPSAEPVDRFIGSGQGFFLKPTGTNSVIFTNAMRDQNNAQFFKTAKTNSIEKNRLWLNFTNDQGAFKQALLGYMEGATNGIDLNYDATTMSGNTYVDFYSISNAKKLTVQARALPFDNTETIPLGYKTTIAGDFTIAIDHVDGFFTNQAVYLEDKTTSKIVDLRTGNYTFTSAIGTFTDRFVLRYTDKTLGTGDFENLDNTVLVSVKDKSIKVTSSKENIKEVLIYNVGGQDVYNKKKVNATELQITNFEVADQVLLVKVTLENGYTVTKKIVFH